MGAQRGLFLGRRQLLHVLLGLLNGVALGDGLGDVDTFQLLRRAVEVAHLADEPLDLAAHVAELLGVLGADGILLVGDPVDGHGVLVQRRRQQVPGAFGRADEAHLRLHRPADILQRLLRALVGGQELVHAAARGSQGGVVLAEVGGGVGRLLAGQLDIGRQPLQ